MLSLQLNNEIPKNYAYEIHSENIRMNVYGKFNLSEDPKGEILTIRPIGVGYSLKIIPTFSSAELTGKKISIINGISKALEREIDFTSDISAIEFIPQGKQGYRLVITYMDKEQRPAHSDLENEKTNPFYNTDFQSFSEQIGSGTNTGREVNYAFINNRYPGFESRSRDRISQKFRSANNASADDKLGGSQTRVLPNEGGTRSSQISMDSELEEIEREIGKVYQSRDQLSIKKQLAIEHLKKVEEEYKKDYDSMNIELEEIKSRMEADSAILEYYKDQDIAEIEKVFKELNQKLEAAEKQIKLFIEAKQKKTMEIENEIKSNRKK